MPQCAVHCCQSCSRAAVVQAFAAYIKHVGTAMVGDAERERTLVQDLLHFKEKLDRILSDSFSSNEQFGHSLKEAFESFINVRQVCTPCLLAPAFWLLIVTPLLCRTVPRSW